MDGITATENNYTETRDDKRTGASEVFQHLGKEKITWNQQRGHWKRLVVCEIEKKLRKWCVWEGAKPHFWRFSSSTLPVDNRPFQCRPKVGYSEVKELNICCKWKTNKCL